MQLETKQTIAVVGATGLQGQMVCEKLLEAGQVVIGVQTHGSASPSGIIGMGPICSRLEVNG